MSYYNFTSSSALSFSVIHRGRKLFVNFSLPINGVARYMTRDEGLAKKICAHRWFRQGLIQLAVQDEADTVSQKRDEKPATVPEHPTYTILGKPMSPKIPTFRHPIPVDEPVQESPAEEVAGEEVPAEEPSAVSQFTPESVTSFLEAKEYFTTVLGVDRSLCTTKEAIAALCGQYNVEFPNYRL